MTRNIIRDAVQRVCVPKKQVRPSKFPQLRTMAVATVTKEHIDGECVSLPYTATNYKSLFQATRHVMRIHPGWRFTMRRIPAQAGEPTAGRVAAWRTA